MCIFIWWYIAQGTMRPIHMVSVYDIMPGWITSQAEGLFQGGIGWYWLGSLANIDR